MDEQELNQSKMQKSRFTSTLWLKITLIVLASLMVFFIGLYIYYFNGGISAEHRKWSEFGDYIAGIAGILNILAFVGLTVTIHLINKTDSEKSLRIHAEELIIKKIRYYLETLDDLYIPFQKSIITIKNLNNAKIIASETFEVLQPLMTYLFYLKKLDFLPISTKKLIEIIHSYLDFASDVLLSFAIDANDKEGKPVKTSDVLKVYRDMYRYLEGLDVMMTADIANFAISEEDITNYGEKYPEKIKQR